MKNDLRNKAFFIFLLISCSLLYIVLLSKSLDNDMYFEIMSGRDLLAGNFSTATHLGNFPILVQQWLYAVTLAIFDKLGYAGIIGLVFLQDSILWALSSILIYRKTKDKKLAVLSSFFAILFCHNYMINVRPQIITVILLVAELLLLDIYKEKHKFRYLLCIIPILILAANFHQAVFLYHIMILVPFYIDKRYIDYSLVSGTRANIKNRGYFCDWALIGITPIFIACSLCTPYGIDGALYILRTFQSNTYEAINISEIDSIKLMSYVGIKLLLLVGTAIYLLYRQKLDKYTTYFVFLLAILAVTNVRHISIAFIPVMFMITRLDLTKFKHYYTYICASIICFGLIILKVFTPSLESRYGNVANIIENHDAKIFNTAMDLGGWLEYNGYTNIKYDSRCEAFSKEISGVDNMISDYVIVSTGHDLQHKYVTNEEVIDIVDDYDYLITTKYSYVNHIIDWTKVYEDDNCIIWEK